MVKSPVGRNTEGDMILIRNKEAAGPSEGWSEGLVKGAVPGLHRE